MAETLASISLIITAIGGVILGLTQHRQNLQAYQIAELQKQLKECERQRKRLERRIDEYDRWRAKNEGNMAT